MDRAPSSYHRLSVIVPVYNERNTVAEIVRRMRAVPLPLALEIVIVDDGSDDGTREVLATLVDASSRIVLHAQNGGKGSAIRTGLRHVTGDLVLIQDADLEYDPGDWPALLAPVLDGRARVVYGSRFASEPENMSFAHRWGNRFLSGLTKILYRSGLSDMETCYKLFDRRVLDGIRLHAQRFDFEPEVTAKVLRSGVAIHEVPISYAGRDFHEGKKITWRDGLSAVAALAKYRVGPFRAEAGGASVHTLPLSWPLPPAAATGALDAPGAPGVAASPVPIAAGA
jgi:glycosyltransferase involved in cell wall biosynthesis